MTHIFTTMRSKNYDIGNWLLSFRSKVLGHNRVSGQDLFFFCFKDIAKIFCVIVNLLWTMKKLIKSTHKFHKKWNTILSWFAYKKQSNRFSWLNRLDFFFIIMQITAELFGFFMSCWQYFDIGNEKKKLYNITIFYIVII